MIEVFIKATVTCEKCGFKLKTSKEIIFLILTDYGTHDKNVRNNVYILTCPKCGEVIAELVYSY